MRTAKSAAAAGKGSDKPVLRLRSLGGNPAPDDFLAEAHRLGKLTQPAVDRLWDVLEPCLAETVTPEIERGLAAFCRHHEVAEADLSHVIRIARYLLRGAASVNLAAHSFREDLQTVWPASEGLHEVLIGRYESIKAALRGGLLAEAMMQHGHVLQNIEWRVDRVVADTRAPRLEMPIGIVTFTHRYRDRSDALTLQMTAEQLSQAANVFGALARQTQQLQPDPQAPAPPEAEPSEKKT